MCALHYGRGYPRCVRTKNAEPVGVSTVPRLPRGTSPDGVLLFTVNEELVEEGPSDMLQDLGQVERRATLQRRVVRSWNSSAVRKLDASP